MEETQRVGGESRPGMALPLVTVVIPTYARPDLLAHCLDSVLAQTYPADRIEIVVAHNISSDETESVVRQRIDRTAARLVYLPQSNPGPALSRHNGALAGTGEVIAFIDDDCRASPDWIAAGVAAWQDGADIVQGTTLPDPAQPRTYFEKTVQVDGPTPFYETCNIFYDRAAFEQADGFLGAFETLFWGEDTDLGWRVATAGHRQAFAPEALVHHEVFRLSPLRWLREALFLKNLPLLVKHWPQMRRHMYLGYFVHRQSAGCALGVLGTLWVPMLGLWSLLAWLPYAAIRFAEGGRFSNPLILAARLLVGMPRALLTTGVLAYGSIRHRCLLL